MGINVNRAILDEIKKNNNMVTTAQVCALGYSKQLLVNYVKAGVLVRVRHGVYSLPDTEHDVMFTLMQRSDNIVFSHTSALFLNGVTDKIPQKHMVTVPSASSLPSSLTDECICFYVKPELHDVGLIEKKTALGNTVRCYDYERTVCDLIRSRSRCDEEDVINAVKKYAASEKKQLMLLAKYARLFKVDEKLKRYMEVLL